MPAVSVIVPARNASATIGRTLDALADQDLRADYEVIVVDNGSDDETFAVAEAAPGPVRAVRKEPGRAGSARNRGVSEAASDLLAFVDADCFPTRGWLREGIRALESADLVQGAVRPDPGVRCGPFDRTLWVVRDSGLYETANLFVRKELFRCVEGFTDWAETDVEAPFGEDVWFGWRARRAGARTGFRPEALVYHAVFPRDAGAYLRERRRCSYFPALAAHIPELRDEFFWRRWFLTRRSAAFDVAVAGALMAASARSPIPLAAAVPYAWICGRASLRWRRHAASVLATDLCADAVTFGSLLRGSLRSRAFVL